MILSNIINVETHTATAKFILYAIFERAEYEKRNTILMTQVYIAKLCSCTKQGVNKELKYLQDEGYITYKRALFNNLTTTEITLTDKSIAILNAEASKTSNKSQNKPIKTEPRQPQAEAEKTPQTAPKQVETEQADKVHDSEVEQTEVIITDVQRGCLIALERAVKRGGSYPEIYVEDALQQGVPQELINNILRERFSDGIQ